MVAALLVGLAGAQAPHSIPPGIYTAEEVCRTYLGEEAQFIQTADVRDRCFVVRLKDRTWDEVQGLLRRGYGIQVQASGSQWQISIEQSRADESRRLAREALNITVDAVEIEAKLKLKELNHRRHRDLLAELDDYEARLTAAIQGYRVPEARQFIKDHQVEVERCAALQEYRDSSRWTALVEASGSGESVRLRRPTSSVSPLPTFVANAGLDFERPQHLKMADPQFVQETTRFSWLEFATFSTLSLLNSAGASEYWQHGSFFCDEAPRRLAEKLSTDPKTVLDAIDDLPAARQQFKPKAPLRAQTLTENLLDWAAQTEGEIMAEVHPIISLLGWPEGGAAEAKTLSALMAEWLKDNRYKGNENILPDMEIKALSVDEIYYLFWAKKHWTRPSAIHHLYSQLRADVQDGVLLLSLPHQPLLSFLPVPQPEYWRVVSDHWSLDALRQYAREVTPARHAQWHYALGVFLGFGNPQTLIAGYPALRIIENSGSSEQLWRDAETEQGAVLILSKGQVTALNQLLKDLSLTPADNPESGWVTAKWNRDTFNGKPQLSVSYSLKGAGHQQGFSGAFEIVEQPDSGREAMP